MDRGRLKKMGKKSCFFVYKSGDADVEKKNPEINFVKALSAVCAVLLWRNAFLSVFDLEALANQIGRKEIIFAEIAVSFAVFILLIAAFKVRRLRVIAYLVIFAPFISAACARKFPPPWASWMLVFAAVLYGTCCAMEGCKAKQVFRSLVLISAVFGIAAGISVFAGKQIDQIRVDENGFYQETRQKIRENVIGKAEELAEKIKNKKDGKKLDEEKTDAESKHDREDIEEKNPFRPENDPTQQNGKNDNMTSGGKMDDLKAISSFKPSSEVSTCVVLEKKKTYLYDRWGTTYEDSAWTNEKLEEVVYSSKYYFEEEKEELFLQYPSELTRMQKMCEGWDKSSFSAVKNQIDEALSNIVYDTNPGKTPAKWDFAEYFLFENKKGIINSYFIQRNFHTATNIPRQLIPKCSDIFRLYHSPYPLLFLFFFNLVSHKDHSFIPHIPCGLIFYGNPGFYRLSFFTHRRNTRHICSDFSSLDHQKPK